MPEELESQNQMPQLQDPLIDRAHRYWRQHLPLEFQRLSEKGELENHLAGLVAAYEQDMAASLRGGLDPANAEELHRETLFPQEEEAVDVEEGFDPMALS